MILHLLRSMFDRSIRCVEAHFDVRILKVLYCCVDVLNTSKDTKVVHEHRLQPKRRYFRPNENAKSVIIIFV